MTNDDQPLDERQMYCSRSEAIELAMSAMLWSHAVVMVVVLVFEILHFGPPGVLIGLGLDAALLVIMPVVVLPAAYLIGWLAHRLFDRTSITVEMAVRVFAILFEVNLLGWVLFASLALPG
ncbi:MAG: hypothetical protein H7062_05355 [Candidatus Saccharimonas sp.]|nr:hypothetical protein [Planctomycetaceae bacterium]